MNHPSTVYDAMDKCTGILILVGSHLFQNGYIKIDGKSFNLSGQIGYKSPVIGGGE